MKLWGYYAFYYGAFSCTVWSQQNAYLSIRYLERNI